MMPYIVLGILLGLPLMLGVLFRVGAPHLFFSLLAGELLERYFGDDLETMLFPIVGEGPLVYVKVTILVIPMALTAFFLRKSIKGHKLMLHLVPLVATGLVFAVFAGPLLPTDIQEQLMLTDIGKWLLDSVSLIVGSMIILQLVYLWVINHPSRHSAKHSKHSK